MEIDIGQESIRVQIPASLVKTLCPGKVKMQSSFMAGTSLSIRQISQLKSTGCVPILVVDEIASRKASDPFVK